MNKAELIEAMKNTYQTSGVNMYDHGIKVRDEYHKIINSGGNHPYYDFPRYVYKMIQHKLLPLDITDEYQIFHDCGKPFCKETDDTGRNHYTDHANVSADIWLNLDDKSETTFIVSELMRHDMDFHTARGDDLEKLWRFDLAPTLYFTAWAEIFANAEMFGGIESDSFKIKKKRLIKAASKCRFINIPDKAA